MVICPKCKAENRPEAAFCARCGTILFSLPAPTKPAEQLATSKSPDQPEPSISPEKLTPMTSMDQSVFIQSFTKRPEGSVFGDRFQYDTLIYQDEHEIHYIVTEIPKPNSPSVRICSNPDCRTIHCPVGIESEKFCTQCGHALESRSPLFLLYEADTDKYPIVQPMIDLHMVHPNIHPPISKLQQDMS